MEEEAVPLEVALLGERLEGSGENVDAWALTPTRLFILFPELPPLRQSP